MSDLAITALLLVTLLLILGSGVWVGLTLTGVAWIGSGRCSRPGPRATPWL
jgi:C4-dicarboxylate transporter DctM subunit